MSPELMAEIKREEKIKKYEEMIGILIQKEKSGKEIE
jgi:hypothetical protein